MSKRNLRNLKQPVEKFQGISISHDLLPAEREKKGRNWWRPPNWIMLILVIIVWKTTNLLWYEEGQDRKWSK